MRKRSRAVNASRTARRGGKHAPARRAGARRGALDPFDQAAVGIMHTSIDGYRILHANRKLCEMLGYTQEELLGMTSTDVVHADYRFSDKSRYMEQMLKGELQSFASERKFVRKDGTPVWVNRTVSLVRDASGRPEYFIRVIEDITERKRAEEAVARERALLNAVVDTLPDRIYAKDREGRFLLMNRANLDLRRADGHESVVGKTVFDIFPRELAERIDAEDRRVMESGVPMRDRERSTEVRVEGGPKADIRWQLTTKVPMRDAAGNVIGLVGVNRDITARKRAEEAVRQSRQFLEKAQEVAHIGHWVSDPQRGDGKLYWSRETCRIFGLTEEQFDGRVETFFNLVHPDDRDAVAKASSAALAGRQPYSIDHRIIRPDGAVRWIHEEADITRDAEGRPLQMIGVSQDITERTISERRREMEHAVTGVLAESASLEAAMPRLIRTMCEAMEWAYGARWICDERDGVLRRLECWSDFEMDFDPADAALWRSQDVRQSGAGRLLRRVWSRKEPTWLEDIQQTAVRRQASARKFGLHSAFAFPIVAGDSVIGVMEFFGREARQPDEMLLQVARSIGSQIGQFIQRKQAEAALRASEERLKVIFDTEPECVKVVAADGVLLDMNPAGLAMVEADRRDRVVGKVIADLVHPLDREAFVRLHRTAARGASGSLQFRLIGLRGTLRWVETSSVPLRDSAGHIASVLSVTRDITARKKAEAALRESEEQFRQLAHNIPQVFWMTDAEQKQLIYVSPGYEEISGQSIEEVKANPRGWLEAVHPEDRDRIKLARRRAVESTYDETFRLVRPDGAVRWVHDRAFPVRDETGAVYRIAGIAEDVTERKLAEERLMQLAHYDVLTSLPNRVLFYDRLKHALAQAKRNQWTVGVLFIDVDRFKNINDTLGHAVGDQLLQQISERLAAAVRADDTVGRLGGDEFAIVLTHLASPQDANLVAQKILASFHEAFRLGGSELYVTASIGITLYPDDSTDQDTLIKNADAAMYRAKEVGRNTYQFYTPEMNTRAIEILGMENSLRRALDRGEFLLHFQPKASIAEGATVGVEALLRWQHPERGLVSPGEFIPVLEETGLIMAVGDWVVQAACAQIKAWQGAGIEPVPIAINLSARQFQSHTLGARIISAIEEAGIPPHLLEIEITESSLMHNAEGATSTLHYLKAYGLRISIDDFGTGYSSLAYLKRFPLDALKIDRSFVRDISSDADDATITRAVISMAHSLGLRVIAEGVETEAQLGFLAEYGCDEIQGYYLSRPVAAEDCGVWLRERRGLPRSPQAADSAPSVLLVDDDDDALTLLRRTLAKDGYRILAARNAHEGLELLGKHRVDVVISDQNMPGIPGTEFLQRAKSLSPRTVRMIISGQPDVRPMTEAVGKGEVFRFLEKGTGEERLRADVRDALRVRTEAAAATGQHPAIGSAGK